MNAAQNEYCGYCNEQKNDVSPMMSNGYRICRDCMTKYGWKTIETMAEWHNRQKELNKHS